MYVASQPTINYQLLKVIGQPSAFHNCVGQFLRTNSLSHSMNSNIISWHVPTGSFSLSAILKVIPILLSLQTLEPAVKMYGKESKRWLCMNSSGVLYTSVSLTYLVLPNISKFVRWRGAEPHLINCSSEPTTRHIPTMLD